jgi:curli biogenesis system outer membrane secretion channel CsgG
MKIRQPLLILTFLVLITSILSAQRGNKDTKVGKTKAESADVTCKGLPRDQRARVSVGSFDITRTSAQGKLGNELATMLSNALSETQCFNVLVSLKKTSNLSEEVAAGQGGMIDDETAAEGGKWKGAQLIVTGEVTEFEEDYVHILGVGNTKAHIGFILQIQDPKTREIIWSKSLERKVTKPQIQVLKTDIMSFGSKAMEDAVEKSIFDATELIVGQKSLFESYQNKGGNASVTPSASAGTCGLLSNGASPKIMVIIPEIHIGRVVPDPAGETEIINRLIKAGFTVIDPSIYAAARADGRALRAAKDPAVATRLGAEYNVDIIVTGEAFSNGTNSRVDNTNLVTCRARVEARAVRIADGSIISADGKEAGAADISELVAGKSALREAGGKWAHEFIIALCGQSNGGSSSNSMVSKGGGNNSISGGSRSQIELKGVNFSTLSKLEAAIKGVSGVVAVTKKMEDGKGVFEVQHTCTLDDIANALSQEPGGLKVEITEFSGSKIEGKVK